MRWLGRYAGLVFAEVAVEAFLSEQIAYVAIAGIIQSTLEQHQGTELKYIDDVLHVDRRAREIARDMLCKFQVV